jgi:hypothetical protein
LSNAALTLPRRAGSRYAVLELNARERGLVHRHLRPRIRAQDEELRLHQLDDLVADGELGPVVAPDHGELVAPADTRVDANAVARRVEVLGAVPHRHLVAVGPRPEHLLARRLARRVDHARDHDLLIGGRVTHPTRP